MRLPLAFLLWSVLVGLALGAVAQESAKPLLKVIQHAEPLYPALARQARIQGEVRVKITTNGDSVVSAESQTGHPLLAKATEDNIRTWKFVAHEPGTFLVSFRYRFLSENGEVAFLEIPAVVDVAAQLPIVSIDNFSKVGLGRWKAQLRSARGKSQQVFDLLQSGPRGDWVEGRAIGAHGQDEEIDLGYIEESLFGFPLTLSLPHGKRVKFFFIGNMSGDKIKGTFVDDTGTTGEWTAVRVGDNIPPG